MGWVNGERSRGSKNGVEQPNLVVDRKSGTEFQSSKIKLNN